MSASVEQKSRFEFGENWRNFVDDVTEPRIQEAQRSLQEKLRSYELTDKSFLDVGCGSGLFSLAAVRLGAAPVHSFDYDPKSVEATRGLKSQYARDASWSIDAGDATDGEFMKSLGQFDIVYSWGVLHHTGAMWKALANTCDRVKPFGVLFISIYNDQGRTSRRWRSVKRLYNRLPRPLRTPYAVGVMLPWEARRLGAHTLRGKPQEYVRGWTAPRERGMSRWHDLLDWVGGYPFEVARPEEVFDFCRERGFELAELKTCGGGLGCNEFVFRRLS